LLDLCLFCSLLYFQKQRCNDTISKEFQFEEEKIGKYRVYKYSIDNSIMCLGVKKGCDDATLYLISLTKENGRDRRCYFEKP